MMKRSFLLLVPLCLLSGVFLFSSCQSGEKKVYTNVRAQLLFSEKQDDFVIEKYQENLVGRLNAAGLLSPKYTLSCSASGDTLDVFLKGVDQTAVHRLNKLLLKHTSQSALRKTLYSEDILSQFMDADAYLVANPPSQFPPQRGDLHPLSSLVNPFNQDPVIGLVAETDMERFESYIHYLQEKRAVAWPEDFQLGWSQKPAAYYLGSNYGMKEDAYLALAISGDNGCALYPLGDYVSSYSVNKPEEYPSPSLSVELNAEGTIIWDRMSMDNIGRTIAMTDGTIVYSWPFVAARIQGGRFEVTGGYTVEELETIADVFCAPSADGPERLLSLQEGVK